MVLFRKKIAIFFTFFFMLPMINAMDDQQSNSSNVILSPALRFSKLRSLKRRIFQLGLDFNDSNMKVTLENQEAKNDYDLINFLISLNNKKIEKLADEKQEIENILFSDKDFIKFAREYVIKIYNLEDHSELRHDNC